ncbi:MAG: flagellar hook protein FlgE [Bdellovibrionales bacterium]|jgi:flagellar hook protein FlgE|nr:flagellar hook protein FlgE [Bdellovibrionales bacterium]MBT3527417.1 flagellar hook protein FlgE [Bdellovibrionales bacterium]MBT7670473.1 flagellar hook protein FlgE [Bdellovibrionales bacterium]MBT7767868.1 flagellar hook protein FlgE [Bdellovibrionales bacterium]
MGILNTFNIGVSGLQAAGGAMGIIGDNIANAGTAGFKASRAQFQDVLSTSLKGIEGGDQFGAGTRLAHIKSTMTQGNISRTESMTDIAMNGNGFFQVKGKEEGLFFTRDGSFQFNKDGHLINGDGLQVMGFQANEEGEVTNTLGTIGIGSTTIPASATEKVKFMMNLNQQDDVKQFDIKEPEKTSNFSTSLTIYDNIGTARLVTVFFNKVSNNNWDYRVTADGKDVEGGEVGQFVELGKSTLTFSGKGILQVESENKLSFNFKGASADQKIEFDFGESVTEGGDGFNATTQYGSTSAVSKHSQDGASAATLTSLSFNDQGVLRAVYNNGVTRQVAQIAIAKFQNAEGLFKVGKNLYKSSTHSGDAAMGKPGIQGRGKVLSKSVELSNVDLATEFVDLMTHQRNFQANAKTITTADEMLKEVLSLKR